MSDNGEPEPRLPEGTTVLEREPAEESPELAAELERLGGSETLVKAVSGERDAEPDGAEPPVESEKAG